MNSTFATPSGPDWLVASGPLPAIPISAGGSGWGSGSMKFYMPHTPSVAPRPLLPATRGSEATVIASSKIKTSETTTTTLVSIYQPGTINTLTHNGHNNRAFSHLLKKKAEHNRYLSICTYHDRIQNSHTFVVAIFLRHIVSLKNM